MNYKNKFQENEWLTLSAFPLFLIKIILGTDVVKNSESRKKIVREGFAEILSNYNDFDSGLLKELIINMESANSAQNIRQYADKANDYVNEADKIAAILNRKVSDDEKKEFLNDFFSMVINICTKLTMGTDERTEMLGEILPFVIYIQNN